MELQRAIPIRLPENADRRASRAACCSSQDAVREDTPGVRRVRIRLSGRRKRRTADVAHLVATRLIEWTPVEAAPVEAAPVEAAPVEAAPVEADAQIKQPYRELPRGAIHQAVANTARQAGSAITWAHPASPSQHGSRCGWRGKRDPHPFTSPACGHAQHAGAAATTIRTRSVPSRRDGSLPPAPTALPHGEDKPSVQARNR
jgi:hypothetical protein